MKRVCQTYLRVTWALIVLKFFLLPTFMSMAYCLRWPLEPSFGVFQEQLGQREHHLIKERVRVLHRHSVPVGVNGARLIDPVPGSSDPGIYIRRSEMNGRLSVLYTLGVRSHPYTHRCRPSGDVPRCFVRRMYPSKLPSVSQRWKASRTKQIQLPTYHACGWKRSI